MANAVILHFIFFWHKKQYIFTFIRILSFSFTQKFFLNIKYLVTSLKIEQHQQKTSLSIWSPIDGLDFFLILTSSNCDETSICTCFLDYAGEFFPREGIFEQIYFVPLKIWLTFQLCFGPTGNHLFSDSLLVRNKAQEFL